MQKIRSYQNTSFSKYPTKYAYLKQAHLKIGIAVMVSLFLLSGALIYFLVREDARNRNLMVLVVETSKGLERINKALVEKDLQRAFGDLHGAQKRMVAFLTPTAEKAPVEEPVKVAPVQGKTLPVQVSVTLPDLNRDIPSPFIFSGDGEYVLLCEKERKIVYVFKKAGGNLSLVKAYPCLIGANEQDKRKNGDLATPVGVYVFLRFIPGKSLADIYGYGAFVLNYPNFLDRRVGKDGTGIWLHGHSAAKSLGDEIVNTKGCIVVSNEAMKEMSEYLKPNGTAIAIVNKISFTKTEDQGALSKELTAFVDDWRKAWESRSVQKYMSFYSPEFVSADGMSYQAFKKHKEKVNRGKAFIRVATENLMILLPPEREGKVAVARFHQKYESSNFKTESNKILYLRNGQRGWHIIGESSF